MAVGTHRSEFAGALRAWRGRRRVRQLELALAAGTTQCHVSFIESDRSVPGREMVVRLAEALDVPLRERTLLLLAAGYAPAYEESDLDDPRIDPIRNRSSGFSPGTVPTRRSSPIAMATSSPEARRSGH
jgi:transcriptional regulator with XRE-family HTH domain